MERFAPKAKPPIDLEWTEILPDPVTPPSSKPFAFEILLNRLAANRYVKMAIGIIGPIVINNSEHKHGFQADIAYWVMMAGLGFLFIDGFYDWATRRVSKHAAARPSRLGLFFGIGEPFVGKVRRETPAKYAFQTRCLKVTIPGLPVAVGLLVHNWTGAADRNCIALGFLAFLLGGTVWDSLDKILFDAEARQLRRDQKSGLPAARVPYLAGTPFTSRATYQREKLLELMGYGLVAGLLYALPWLHVVPANFLPGAPWVFEVCAALVLCLGLSPAANLVFGGYEVMVEQARREGVPV